MAEGKPFLFLSLTGLELKYRACRDHRGRFAACGGGGARSQDIAHIRGRSGQPTKPGPHDRETYQAERPKPAFTPAATLDEAIAKSKELGVDARHRTADVVELMANQYAAHRGFTDERPREGFVKNWTRKLKGSQADNETALAAMNGINRAVHEGKAKPVPTVIRKPTPDDDGAFVGGRYNDDTQHILIFDQGTTYAGRKVDPIEGRRVTIPDTYDDFMTGIYVHEYGHHRTMSENPEMLARARTVYNSTDQQAIKKHVSLYAASDHKELAAEAHTLRVHPGYDRMPAETKAIVTKILGES